MSLKGCFGVLGGARVSDGQARSDLNSTAATGARIGVEDASLAFCR